MVPDELGPLAPVLAAAGTIDPDDRVDAAALSSGLADVARHLPAPERLPLAGTQPLDAGRDPTDDPTQLPPVRPRLFDREQPSAFDADTDTDGDEIFPMALTGPRSKRKRRTPVAVAGRWPLVTVLALVVALLLGGGVALATGVFVPSHPVPNLQGKTLAQAPSLLAPGKFKLAVVHGFDETVPKDRHHLHRPPAGRQAQGAPHGHGQALRRSQAAHRSRPHRHRRGDGQASARAGLGVTSSSSSTKTVPEGPGPRLGAEGTGKELARGEPVNLTVSNGPNRRARSPTGRATPTTRRPRTSPRPA